MFSWKTFNILTMRSNHTWWHWGTQVLRWICKYNIYINQYTIDTKTQNHTVTLNSTLQLRSSNRSDIYIFLYIYICELWNLFGIFQHAFKIKTYFSPFCLIKSHAFSYITLSTMYLESLHVCLVTHKTFRECIPWSITAYCGIRCSYHFNVGSLQTEKPERSNRPLPFASYKARRVGELRISTQSALFPPPLWLSSPSARESSSGHANVNTDR